MLKILCELLDVIIIEELTIKRRVSLLSKTQERDISFSSSRNTLTHKSDIAKQSIYVFMLLIDYK